jgi:hypothetical protein
MRYLYFSLILILNIVSCQSRTESEGEALAKKNCASCHKFPEPSLLDKKTWKEGVLPEMAYRLGVGNRFELLTKIPEEQYESATNLGIYPETPEISQQDWEAIVAYYVENAPEKPLAQAKKAKISAEPMHFTSKEIMYPDEPTGVVTSVTFNPKQKEIWIGKRNQKLEILDAQLKIKKTIRTERPIVYANFQGKNSYLVSIGKMSPNDQKLGSLLSMNQKNVLSVAADSLKRPVDMQIADIDQDGIDDFVICEYGFEAGELIWINGKSKQKNILKIQAGTRNVSIKDITGDGLPDILVLTAQSREGVSLFINKGQGKFMEKPILLFDSVYGCSFMEVCDFNKDGKDDIIITNGDNADYSKTLKNYHGVHLFINDGRNNFKEKYFYPVYGATKTIARDFDLDGDLDLAMIAFYSEPSMTQNESFLYFQNQGNLNFKVSNLNIPFGGRWMVMDAGDADQDGDLDILLGNFQFGAPKKGKVKPGLQLNYIENKIH